jgi:hypothetical protein
VLREEPDLLDAIHKDHQKRAIDRCIAPVARLGRGRWSGKWPERVNEAIDLLVLHGLLTRRVRIDGRYGADLDR